MTDLEKSLSGLSSSTRATYNFTCGVPATRPKQRVIRYLLVFVTAALLLKTLLITITSHPARIQYAFQAKEQASLAQEGRRAAVKREFLHAWYGYKDHAWMADSLMSLTGDRKDQFCGWSATLVDSLDTLWIMGLHNEFNEAIDAVMLIDFEEVARGSKPDPATDQIPFPGLSSSRTRIPKTCVVNLFESVIRYLGGMLAAYDLSGDDRLKVKLVELGQMLHRAWRTENGMPCSYCDPVKMASNATLTSSSDVPLADIGSFYLELARLSQITGDSSYYHTVEAMTHVLQRTQNGSVVRGLWPERVDARAIYNSSETLEATHHAYSLGALSDSAYEYLVKGHLMLGGLTKSYRQMWDMASSIISNTLIFRASIPDWDKRNVMFSGILHEVNGQVSLEPRTEHLACFAGGMFGMSAKMFNKPEDLEIGQALTEGCVWAYAQNNYTGIMPETFSLLPCPKLDQQCVWDQTMWDLIRNHPESIPEICTEYNCAGRDFPDGYLSSIDAKYVLRPEAIESVFIMYRITGDEKWRDAGWEMFQNIIKHTRTPYGHASLSTVLRLGDQRKYISGRETVVQAAFQTDEMESFWLAETLKYFYLLFSEVDLISLDEWVLNTEAHPLRLQSSSRGFGR